MTEYTQSSASASASATATAPDLSAEIAALQARLAEAEQQVATLRDQSLRAAAEADNVRKRAEREISTSL